MNKIYILGGFGTRASNDILKKIIAIFEESNIINSDSDYIKFCLDSHPSEFNHLTEKECDNSLFQGIRRADMHYKSCNDTTKLFLAIGCNTMHLSMFKYLQSNKLPKNICFVPITEAITDNKMFNSGRKFYLWSTKETYNQNIYHDVLNKHNISIEPISHELLTLIEKLIECIV